MTIHFIIQAYYTTLELLNMDVSFCMLYSAVPMFVRRGHTHGCYKWAVLGRSSLDLRMLILLIKFRVILLLLLKHLQLFQFSIM